MNGGHTVDVLSDIHRALKRASAIAETEKLAPLLVYLIEMAATEAENEISKAISQSSSGKDDAK